MELVSWLYNVITSTISSIQTWIYGGAGGANHGAAILTIFIVGAIAYFIGGRIISRLVRRAVRTTHQKQWHKKDIEKRQNTLSSLAKSTWRIIVILMIIYALLREFIPDVNTLLAPLFASAGIIGVAIGFGAQSMIKDFLSGIFIISENQYRVGDIVDIEGAAGTVERIGTRTTVLRDVDGNVHYFPNGMVMHVINKTMGYSMARFIVAVDPASSIDEITKIINDLGTTLAKEEKWQSKIIEAPAFVSVGEMTGTSIEIIVAGKTQPSDQWAVVAEMRRRLLTELEKADIKLGIVPPMMPSLKK